MYTAKCVGMHLQGVWVCRCNVDNYNYAFVRKHKCTQKWEHIFKFDFPCCFCYSAYLAWLLLIPVGSFIIIMEIMDLHFLRDWLFVFVCDDIMTYAFSKQASLDMFCTKRLDANLNRSSAHSCSKWNTQSGENSVLYLYAIWHWNLLISEGCAAAMRPFNPTQHIGAVISEFVLVLVLK